MATYPIKMLKDEEGNPFVPLINIDAIKELGGDSLMETIEGKLEVTNIIAGRQIDLDVDGNNITINNSAEGTKLINNLDTTASGTGALDAAQGKVLKDNIPEVINNLTTIDSKKALSAHQGYVLAGRSVPVGGGTGQVLMKSADDDYSLTWGDAADPNAIVGDGSIKKIVELTYDEYIALEEAGQLEDTTEYHISDMNEQGGTYITESEIQDMIDENSQSVFPQSIRYARCGLYKPSGGSAWFRIGTFTPVESSTIRIEALSDCAGLTHRGHFKLYVSFGTSNNNNTCLTVVEASRGITAGDFDLRKISDEGVYELWYHLEQWNQYNVNIYAGRGNLPIMTNLSDRGTEGTPTGTKMLVDDCNLRSRHCLYTGNLKGGETVTFTGKYVKRYLDVYCRIQFSTSQSLTIKYTIDTKQDVKTSGELANLAHGSGWGMPFDVSEVQSMYGSESYFNNGTKEFVHRRIGYTRLTSSGEWADRNGNDSYFIYQIETYD